jgi:hypothetical protein
VPAEAIKATATTTITVEAPDIHTLQTISGLFLP